MTLVADARRPAGGYWAAFSDGTVEAAGGARSLGGPADPASTVVGISSTGVGAGYWLVTSAGHVYDFGDAEPYGSLPRSPASPVVGIAATPTGRGYWLVQADGHVDAFGDARTYGPARTRLAAPIVAITGTADGRGYWLVSAAGNVYGFGDAAWLGSAAGRHRTIVAMARTPSGAGYWLASSTGNVYNYGDAAWRGSATAGVGTGKVVGITPAGPGYWLLTSTGHVISVDAPPLPSVKVAAVLPAGREPAAPIAPPAAFDASCLSGGRVAACNAAALRAIDAARASEGYGPLSLPPDFASLDDAAQMLAVTNAERTSRALPPLSARAALEARAQAAADTGRDPEGPAGYAWGANAAWGYETPLAADFAWMYDDGPGSPNVDCPTAGASGCWNHRRNILAPWGGASGAGDAHVDGTEVLTELLVRDY